MSDNPYQSPVTPTTPTEDQSSDVTTLHAAYNIVSDTVGGVNVRWSDNILQAGFVTVTVALGAVIGIVVALLNSRWNLPWFGGAMIGAFAGLVVGIFSSGIFLMFYRALRHSRGKHD